MIPHVIHTTHKVFDNLDIKNQKIQIIHELQHITGQVSAILFCGSNITDARINGNDICDELAAVLGDCM